MYPMGAFNKTARDSGVSLCTTAMTVAVVI